MTDNNNNNTDVNIDKNKIPITYNCSVCVESYDVNKKKPFILSPCGHILCNSCMTCINKLGENMCPTCKLTYEKTHNNLTSSLVSTPDNQVKIELAKIKALKADFLTCYTNEMTQKSKYFQSIRLQVKAKTQQEIAKLHENETKILAKMNELEMKFDGILASFSTFDKNLAEDIEDWEAQIEKSTEHSDSNLSSAIQTEKASLENLIAKLKTV
jgi:hypothetical protein